MKLRANGCVCLKELFMVFGNDLVHELHREPGSEWKPGDASGYSIADHLNALTHYLNNDEEARWILEGLGFTWVVSAEDSALNPITASLTPFGMQGHGPKNDAKLALPPELRHPPAGVSNVQVSVGGEPFHPVEGTDGCGGDTVDPDGETVVGN